MLAQLTCFAALLTAPAEATEPQPQMRLFYASAKWETVLGDIAETAGLQLVAPSLPPGRYSNTSMRKMSPEQALRIANDELTESGFRAMVRGEFLIVLKDKAFQPTFPRYKFGTRAGDGAAPNGDTESADQAGRIRPVSANRPATLAEPLRLATHETAQPIAPPATPTGSPIDLTAPAQPAVVEVEAVIRPRRLTARGIGRDLYAALREHAQLVDDGPRGLPAFRAQVTEPITIAVDAAANELVFVGSEPARREIVEVVDRIDLAPPNQAIRLIAGSESARQTVRSVHPALQTMLAMQDDAAAPPRIPAAEASGTAGDDATAPEPQTPASREQLTELLDQLRSDVAIESLDSLGLLILRGNEADVEAVSKIIAAIERAGAGTSPEVHLRLLEAVDGAAVADLINSTYEAVDEIETKPFRDGKRVIAIPVVRPNAVLIIAPAAELESVLALVDKLDRPVDPEIELQVIPLRGASAVEAVETIREFYDERGGLGTRVTVSADPRTNALLVRANPNDLAEIRRLVAKLDADAAGSVSRVRIYDLQYAEADELAAFLQEIIEDIIEPAGQVAGGQGQQSQRSVALEFFAGPGAGLVRSGVLSEVRISGDERTNTLAVVAPPKSQPLFEALVDALDQPAGATAEIKVFTLTNADASAAANLLGDLFVDSTAATGDGPPGLRLAGASDAASNLLPVTFSVDVRTNSILAVGGPDALTVVEAVLLRLDSATPRERVTQVLKLKNAPADEVAEAINLFLESQRELAEVNPDLVSTVDLLDREVIVVPEVISNNLLISAALPYFDEIIRIATELDAQPPQVVVQALLVEVELDNLDELGVELGFQDDILFDRSTIENVVTVTETVTGASGVTQTIERVISQAGNPGFLFNNPSIFPQLGNNVSTPGQSMVGEQGLSNFGVGRVSSGLDFGGLVLSASSDSVSVLIRALSQQRNVHILSRPQIRTVDGQLAEIQVGQQVPIVNGVIVSTLGLAQPQIVYDEAGIILSVTPRISPDGQIVMEVVAERSAYDFVNGVPIFTDADSGNTIVSPVKNVTVARSTVSVRNGQTVVLGGLITQRDETVVRKVPWLGDLPIIGRAFRYDLQDNLRTELIMFLTPRIVASDLDNEIISEVEAGRLNFFREEAERAHGPLFGVPDRPGAMPPAHLPPYDVDTTPPAPLGPSAPYLDPNVRPEIPIEQLPPLETGEAVPAGDLYPATPQPVPAGP